MFEGKSPSPMSSIKQSKGLFLELEGLKNYEFRRSASISQLCALVKWRAPREEFIKVNFVASFSKEIKGGSIGVIARDYLGCVIADYRRLI